MSPSYLVVVEAKESLVQGCLGQKQRFELPHNSRSRIFIRLKVRTKLFPQKDQHGPHTPNLKASKEAVVNDQIDIWGQDSGKREEV